MPERASCSSLCSGCRGCGGSCAVPHPGMVPPSKPPLAAEHAPQWPIQLCLAPLESDDYRGVHLLVAGACTAVASSEFHQRFLKNRAVLLACPAMDPADHLEKRTHILQNNAIRTVTILRMDHACCSEIQHMVRGALRAAEKFIPWQMVTLADDGSILD